LVGIAPTWAIQSGVSRLTWEDLVGKVRFPPLTALLKTHPVTTLDCLLDPVDGGAPDAELFEPSVTRASAIETLDPDTLIAWADAAPDRRYPRLGVPVFKVENLDQVTGLSPAFVFVLSTRRTRPGSSAILTRASTQ